MTWAARWTSLSNSAAKRGDWVGLGDIIAGSRRRGDGVLLAWRYTNPRTIIGDGIIPFLIDWV